MKRTLLALFVLAVASQAAVLDGHWTAETSIRSKKSPEAKTTTFVLDLKTQGDALTGNITVDGAKKARTAAIHDAVLDGNTYKFVTETKANKKIEWTLSLSGDQLNGTLWREGAKHSLRFVANRAN